MNEQHISKAILTIYANLKWKLRIADRNIEQVNALIDEAIEEVKKQIHPSYQLDVIQKFEQMKNRLSEFVVDGRLELPPMPAEECPVVELHDPPNKHCDMLPHLMRRTSKLERETEYFVLCPKCNAEGLASLNPAIALENWNQGKID